MKLDISELSYDAKWYEFKDGARLKIRPFPASQGNLTVRTDGTGMVLSGGEQLKVFQYCLVEWENLAGADGKPIPCTDEVKEKIFDFRLAGIPEFVLAKSRQFEVAKEGDEKNS